MPPTDQRVFLHLHYAASWLDEPDGVGEGRRKDKERALWRWVKHTVSKLRPGDRRVALAVAKHCWKVSYRRSMDYAVRIGTVETAFGWPSYRP